RDGCEVGMENGWPVRGRHNLWCGQRYYMEHPSNLSASIFTPVGGILHDRRGTNRNGLWRNLLTKVSSRSKKGSCTADDGVVALRALQGRTRRGHPAVHPGEKDGTDWGTIARVDFKCPLAQTTADHIGDRLSRTGNRSQVGPPRGVAHCASDWLAVD